MDYVVDLDAAALEIEQRRPRWASLGLQTTPTTWRDASAPWPQAFETDRATVRDPDSIGVSVRLDPDTEFSITLFRGGWADLDIGLLAEDVAETQYVDIRTAVAFGNTLDGTTDRLLRSGRGG